MTSLRLINLDNPSLQHLLRDWTSLDPDESGNIYGGEIVAGYSFAKVPNLFQAPSSSNPQSSALLPEYSDDVLYPSPGNTNGANSVGVAPVPTIAPNLNFTSIPVSVFCNVYFLRYAIYINIMQ